MFTRVKRCLRQSANSHRVAEARYDREHPGAASLLPGAMQIYQENGVIAGIELEGSSKNINRLSNLVCGLPKLNSGEIDSGLAVQVINSSFRQMAAGDFLYAVALKVMRDRNADPQNLRGTDPHATVQYLEMVAKAKGLSLNELLTRNPELYQRYRELSYAR